MSVFYLTKNHFLLQLQDYEDLKEIYLRIFIIKIIEWVSSLCAPEFQLIV